VLVFAAENSTPNRIGTKKEEKMLICLLEKDQA
jgi:hypothetical protein